MTRRRTPEPAPALVNVGTCALVLDDGRRVEPGQPLPADTPEDRIAFWMLIGAVGSVNRVPVEVGELVIGEPVEE